MLGNIFNVFSKRSSSKKSETQPLTQEFRNRILMLLRDSTGGALTEFFIELHKKLAYLHGKPVLSHSGSMQVRQEEDVLEFLLTCGDEYFLDAIEYLFQINASQYFTTGEEEIVDQINAFLKIDNLPYHLTKSIWEEVDGNFHGTPTKMNQLREPPRIICKDNEVIHSLAIEPALTLLKNSDLLNANEEFMLALEDYRKHDYKDCITKCCSSLESVMKIICERNGYTHQKSDTASTLLKAIIQNSKLDSFWEQPIILIATIRNKLSSSHGSGSAKRVVPSHIAKFTLSVTASTILFLCDDSY